jgi:hypothetical protein
MTGFEFRIVPSGHIIRMPVAQISGYAGGQGCAVTCTAVKEDSGFPVGYPVWESTGQLLYRDMNGVLVVPGGPFGIRTDIYHSVNIPVPECDACGRRWERTGRLVEEYVDGGQNRGYSDQNYSRQQPGRRSHLMEAAVSPWLAC